MLSQLQHLYNGLARPADCSIFCTGMASNEVLAQIWTCPHELCAGRRPARLARADVGTGWSDTGINGQTSGHGDGQSALVVTLWTCYGAL